MNNKTEVIQHFLNTNAKPDLAALYNFNMEVQVNVAQDEGTPLVEEFRGKKWRAWTDGNQTWKSFRIPFNAATKPEYTDSPVKFDFKKHVDAIGMTGWNWKNQESIFVAYDFDAITGHSDKHARKLTQPELAGIVEIVKSIPWIQVRKSASGNGLHLYVHLFPHVKTVNHHEHAAVARAILSKLSMLTGVDFGSKVDICGGNMWVWHRKGQNTDGFSVIQQHTESLADVPINWRDHIKVVTGAKRRTTPEFITNDDSESTKEDSFNQLCGQFFKQPLTDVHKKLIEWLKSKDNTVYWWDSERHMLVTHTVWLKEAQTEIPGIKGCFDTISAGTEKGSDHNCFMFPLPNGAWSVKRFSPGCMEHESWSQDASGWTSCYFNKNPDLRSAARSKGGVELPNNGGYQFQEAEIAVKVASMLGTQIQFPTPLLTRPASLKEQRDGRIVMSVEANAHYDSVEKMAGWARKGKNWLRVFDMPNHTSEMETPVTDDVIRHTVSELERADIGWYIFAESHWQREKLEHVRAVLANAGYPTAMIQPIIGQSVTRAWREVNIPFADEYPGNRDWNKKGARLKVQPSTDLDNLNYPTWMKVLNHLGEGLNEALKSNTWAVQNSILTGGDYLKCWVASLIQQPFEQLPYLFLFGNQDCGKSIFHEALQLLFDRGHIQANNALLSTGNFNGELANAVLCYIEEVDLSKAKFAYARVKDWVTGKSIQIHEKGKTPITIPNTTHWFQVANSHTFCPAFTGDTRITVIRVNDLDPLDLIPKKKLLEMLQREAPDFVAAIKTLELPEPVSRLNIPVITTSEKLNIESNNESPVLTFFKEKTFAAPGFLIRFDELHARFLEWCSPEIRPDWGKIKFAKEIPTKFAKGRHNNNVVCVGNISFKQETEVKKPYILNDSGFLREGV